MKQYRLIDLWEAKMKDLTILKANGSDDLKEVKKLFIDYGIFYQKVLNLDLSYQNFGDEIINLPGRYAEPDGALFLAKLDGEPIGCTSFYKFSDEACELKRLFVLEEHQGIGAGKALMLKAIEEAIAVGYKKMLIHTALRLAAALQLYEKLGFIQVEPYNDYPIFDSHYMELDLIKYRAQQSNSEVNLFSMFN